MSFDKTNIFWEVAKMDRNIEIPEWWEEDDVRSLRSLINGGDFYDLIQLVKKCRKAYPEDLEFCQYKVVREAIKLAEKIA